jgi:dTDP-4-dehydrorhamnose 3,5-epimerase-like enzyme
VGLIRRLRVRRARSGVTVQDYSQKAKIGGVVLVDRTLHTDDSGAFAELARLDEFAEVAGIPNFSLVLGQVNYAEVEPGAIKAWHYHKRQTDVWFVLPRQRLLVGLWDLREDSPTAGVTMRLVLGAGRARLLVIPPGVAHGCVNLSQEPTDIIYFIDQQFSPDPDETDEGRIPWDAIEGFWEMSRG